jgi:hypothetical protein
LQANDGLTAFRYLNGKKVPAKPPPNDNHRKTRVAMVHDSGNQITERRN